MKYIFDETSIQFIFYCRIVSKTLHFVVFDATSVKTILSIQKSAMFYFARYTDKFYIA